MSIPYNKVKIIRAIILFNMDTKQVIGCHKSIGEEDMLSVTCRALGSDDQRSRSFFNDRSEIGDHILQRDQIGDRDRFLPKISILKFRSFSTRLTN